MIQLSPSIAPVNLKTHLNHSNFKSLPEITSIIHQQNNFIKTNNIEMNSQGIGFVSVN